MHMKPDEVFDYFVDMLQAAISIRDKESSYQSGKMLRKVLDYIDENYTKDTLSLNSAATAVSYTHLTLPTN